jgi:predicted peptidase
MNVWSTALILSLTCGQQPAHPDVVERFADLRCATASGPVAYRLYVPPATAGKRLPLVIWFHGRGEAGDDNRQQLAWLELVFGCQPAPRAVEAMVLAVQSGPEQAAWSAARGAVDDWLADVGGHVDEFERLDAVVSEVLRRWSVDRRRIYLAGISQGASACWQYAVRYPHRFAAMLPLGTGQISDQVAPQLHGMPIWAFQSAADGTAQARRMQQIVNRLSARGGRARLTVVPSSTHDCWTAALTEYKAWKWLLRQRRGPPAGGWLASLAASQGRLAAVLAACGVVAAAVAAGCLCRRCDSTFVRQVVLVLSATVLVLVLSEAVLVLVLEGP